MQWLVNSVAVQGRGHLSENIPCQDKVLYKNNDSTCVIALADGAGSARLSHIGAEKTVGVICDYFLEKFDVVYDSDNIDSFKKDILKRIIENLDNLAVENKCSVKDLASTLLCVAVKDDCFISLHLGDGIIACSENGELKVYSAPENGEYANVTFFVTSSNAEKNMRLRKGKLNGVDAFYLMSDGAGSSFYDSQRNVASNALKMMSDLSLMYSENEVRDEITNFFEQNVKVKTLDDCSAIYMTKYKCTLDTFSEMPYSEQLSLLEIKPGSKHEKKRYNRFCCILKLCEKEMSLDNISKRIHLKRRYSKRYVKLLVDNSIIKQNKRKNYINSNIDC